MKFGRIVALCGILGPVIAYLAIALAIHFSPWFDWSGNALSDLGTGEAGFIFNLGLIAAGLVLIPFALFLERFFSHSRLGRSGAIIFLLAVVSLALIGVFPEMEPFLAVHVLVSLLFFSLTAVSSIIIGYTLLKENRRELGWIAIAAGIVIIGCHIIILPIVFWTYPTSAVAIPELVAAVSATIWVVIFSLKILIKGSLE
jgi:hypothetical membrane protein